MLNRSQPNLTKLLLEISSGSWTAWYKVSPSHTSPSFPTHTLQPRHTPPHSAGPLWHWSFTHGAPELLCPEGLSPSGFLFTPKSMENISVNPLPHCTSSLFGCFAYLSSSLRHKWIPKITLSFPRRVMRLENHSIAILLILYFPILLGIYYPFCLTKYQLSKRHQLFISSEVYHNSKLNCLKFRTKHLK